MVSDFFGLALAIFGRDLDDAVGVDEKRDLNTRHAGRARFDAGQAELTHAAAFGCFFAVALQDVDVHKRLVVFGRRKGFLHPQRDAAVALNDVAFAVALDLDAQGMRGDLQQDDFFQGAVEHAGLNRGASGHHLVGVEPFERRDAKEVFDHILHQRDAGGTTH